ncbi:hypothetical protein [Chryseobacterium indoltheticum]|uniref:hypothetical protein n=1 Tax=Chryseobacterium indoltheticum TaxID=254 RepID=UPI003F49AE49
MGLNMISSEFVNNENTTESAYSCLLKNTGKPVSKEAKIIKIKKTGNKAKIATKLNP